MADPTPKPLTPKPLPFDPTGLRGLSEKLLRSHYDNNYSGAVKKLAAVREELARLPDTAPGFVRSGLLHNEAMFRGSVVLHEAYFGHLGGDGKPGGEVRDAIAATWGSADAGVGRLRSGALALAGGSGWALLALDLLTGELAITSGPDHAHMPISAVPLVALDMYEHSYHMDYGTAAARYIDAFFDNLDWERIDARYRLARTAAASLSDWA